MKTRKQIFVMGASFLALMSPASAFAEITDADQTAEVAPPTTGNGFDESSTDIVVTATRREASILDVPLSITALSQDELDTKGVRNIADIARMVPGVTFSQGHAGRTQIAVRGIASSIGAATTGVYIDETPVQIRSLSIASNFYPTVFDLERVEVLRGPQGTLFGAGAMGGAVRFILAKPGLEEYTGSARAEIGFTKGGDPSYEVAAALGGPIAKDRLGFRGSVYYRRDGGYVDRVPDTVGFGSPDKNSNSRESFAGNFALTFAPTDRLSITPSLFYQDLKRNDSDQYWTFQSQDYPEFVNGNGFASTGFDKAKIFALKVEYDFGPAQLVSNSSIVDRDFGSTSDTTGAILEILRLPYNFAIPGGGEASFDRLAFTQKAFTQEIRLQSSDNADSRLSYVLGIFYQNGRQVAREVGDSINLFPTILGLPPATANALFPNGVFLRVDDRSRDRQIAGFVQLDYRLADKLTLTAGARVSRLKFDFSNVSGGFFYGAGSSASGRSSETPFTPKFGIEYKPSANWLLYASAAKGFRPGGANPLAPSTCAANLAALGLTASPATFASDSVWSYEAGVKGRAGGMTLQSSIFNVDWSDIQSATTLPSCGFRYIENRGSARSRGFDAQVNLRPARGLSFDLNVTYTDATNRETINTLPGAPVPGTIVRKGDRFAGPWSGSFAMDYQSSLGSGDLSGYAHLQYDFQTVADASKSYNVNYRPALNRIDDTQFLSARVGVRKADVDVSLFVDNLLNSDAVIGIQHWHPTATRVLEQSFRPRSFGATASYRF